MKVRDAMSRKVKAATPADSVREVAKIMASHDVGVVPIVADGIVDGMVTDRDIVIRVVAQGRNVDAPISESMTSPVEFCFEDDDLDAATEKMARLQVRRLVVVDADQRLAGILSLGDVAQENSAGETGRALEEITEPGGRHSH